MKAYKGTFTANTATGNQTVNGIVDESAAAFTPKAVILWTSYVTADVTFADGFAFGTGMTDGTTSGAASAVASDNVAAQRCTSTITTTMAVMNTAAATTAVRSGAFVSFGSGEFVIDWTVQDGVAAIYHYIALGGDDLDVAVVSSVVQQVRTAVTSAFPLVGHIDIAGAVLTSDMLLGTAFVAIQPSGAFGQGLSNVYIDDNNNPSDCTRFQRADQSALYMTSTNTISAVGAEDPLGMLVSATTAANALTRKALMIGGVYMAGGSLLQPAAPGTQAVTGLGFSPKCVMFFSIGNVALAATTSATDAKLCVGGADRTRQGMALALSTNGVTPSVCVKYSDSSANVIAAGTANATAGSSTIEALADLQSIDADGFTLDWTVADATAREVLWVALGDAPAPASGETAYPFVGAIA